jgi:hypothetical protein
MSFQRPLCSIPLAIHPHIHTLSPCRNRNRAPDSAYCSLIQPPSPEGNLKKRGETSHHRTQATPRTERQARCCTIPTSAKADPRDFSRNQYRNRVNEKIYCSPRPTCHCQVLTVGVFFTRSLCREGQEWQCGRPYTTDVYIPPGQDGVSPGRQHTY